MPLACPFSGLDGYTPCIQPLDTKEEKWTFYLSLGPSRHPWSSRKISGAFKLLQMQITRWDSLCPHVSEIPYCFFPCWSAGEGMYWDAFSDLSYSHLSAPLFRRTPVPLHLLITAGSIQFLRLNTRRERDSVDWESWQTLFKLKRGTADGLLDY